MRKFVVIFSLSMIDVYLETRDPYSHTHTSEPCFCLYLLLNDWKRSIFVPFKPHPKHIPLSKYISILYGRRAFMPRHPCLRLRILTVEKNKIFNIFLSVMAIYEYQLFTNAKGEHQQICAERESQ